MDFWDSPEKRGILLVATMLLTVATVVATGLYVLYSASFAQQEQRLIEVAHSRARLTEAMARYYTEVEHKTEGEVIDIVLTQLRDAHSRFRGFGDTGEFTLAHLDGERIVFVLSHRHEDEHGTLDDHTPIPITSEDAVPIQRALAGESGTIVARDYRGEMVLAAFEPVDFIGCGLVAKIDLSEIREPFVRASLITAALAVVLSFISSYVFIRIGTPVIKKLQQSQDRLAESQRIGNIGSWIRNVADDEVWWSEAMFAVFDMPEADGPHPPKNFSNSCTLKTRSASSKQEPRARGQPFHTKSNTK